MGLARGRLDPGVPLVVAQYHSHVPADFFKSLSPYRPRTPSDPGPIFSSRFLHETASRAWVPRSVDTDVALFAAGKSMR